MSRSLPSLGSIPAPRAFALAGFVLCAAALAAAAGCGMNDVPVTIVNESGAPLDSLRVLGEFGVRRLKPLAAGDSVTVRLVVKGEDAIGLRGRAGDRAIIPAMPVYAEPGLRVRFVVDGAGVVRHDERTGY